MRTQSRRVALDVAARFEPMHPVEAGRGGKVHLPRQLRDGFTSIGLQTLQNQSVDPIQTARLGAIRRTIGSTSHHYVFLVKMALISEFCRIPVELQRILLSFRHAKTAVSPRPCECPRPPTVGLPWWSHDSTN